LFGAGGDGVIVAAVLSALLLVTLIAFPRYLKPAVLCLGLVWGVTAAIVVFDGFRGGNRLENIVATAAFDATCTDPALPVQVSFRNDNRVAVKRLTYTLEGFEQDVGVSVAFNPYQTSDKRIEPGESFATCRAYRLRNNERVDASTLNWRVTINSAEFD